MALAAVVSRLAITNVSRVAAYAAAAGAMRHDHPRRASGIAASRTAAAIPERKPATCHAVSVTALMAAPPVENSTAAVTSRSRLRRGEASIDRFIQATRCNPNRPSVRLGSPKRRGAHQRLYRWPYVAVGPCLRK